jgi:cytoskeletal protein CcmA (bactofilin family)
MVAASAMVDRGMADIPLASRRIRDLPAPAPGTYDAGAAVLFSRKKNPHEGDTVMADTSEGLGLSPKPGAPRPMGATAPRPLAPAAPPTPIPATGASPGPGATATAPTPLSPRPPDAPARRSEGHGVPIIPTPKRDEMRQLKVGRDISLTGEITSCEQLIVEGSVEANLTNCREVVLAESGLLKGTAAIEEADIRGRMEGTITVRRKLLIRSTGRVSGMVRYGQLEVELGGQISGDVQAQATGDEGDLRPTRSIMAMSGDLKN